MFYRGILRSFCFSYENGFHLLFIERIVIDGLMPVDLEADYRCKRHRDAVVQAVVAIICMKVSA